MFADFPFWTQPLMTLIKFLNSSSVKKHCSQWIEEEDKGEDREEEEEEEEEEEDEEDEEDEEEG